MEITRQCKCCGWQMSVHFYSLTYSNRHIARRWTAKYKQIISLNIIE